MRDLRLLPVGGATWLACALLIAGPPRVLLMTAVVGTAAAAVLALVVVRGGRRVSGGAATACLAVAAVVVVCLSCAAQLHQRGSGLLAELTAARATVTLAGAVRGEILPTVAGWPGEEPRLRTVVAVDQVTGRGRTGAAAAGVLVLGGEALRDLPYGARVRLSGRLAPSEPGDEVSAVLVAAGDVSVLADPGPIDRTVNRIRSALLDATDGLSADARGLVPGTAIGDTTRLPADLDRAMRDVSLTHVTAVSGAHFAVLTVAVLGLTALLRLPRYVRAGTTAFVMAGFVLLVHPEPSVVRAGVMGAVSVVGMVLGRPARAVPSLGAAVVVLLVLDPWLARSFGFVLSVLATGSIALLGPPIAARLGRFMPRWLGVAVAVPMAAQAVCAPVLVLLEPGVGLLAVPANVLAAPALVPATVLGVAGAVLAPWLPGLSAPLLQVAGLATWWIAAVARTMAGLAGARAAWPSGAGGAAALALVTAAILAAGLSLGRWPRWVRRLGAVIAALGLLIALAARLATPRVVPPDWEVTQCDVGQGDMLVVRSGPAAGVVIDVGPEASAADRCLDDLGVRRIDLLVLTHHHADHVGGLAGALRGRQVIRALVSPLVRPAASAAVALGELAEAGVPMQVAAVGGAAAGAGRAASGGRESGSAPSEVLVGSGRSGLAHWTVLSPSATAGVATSEPSGSQVNDASVVLLLQTPAVTVLALGDAEEGAQEGVARRLAAAGGPQADVVKVAHHGSRSQSERLAELVRPAVALISVGRDNDYGHPAGEAIRLYADRGALVLGTHECGPITLSPVSGRAREIRVTADCDP